MSDAQRSYSVIKLLGVQGKVIDIIPTTKGMKLTEVYNKSFEYLFTLVYALHKKKYQFVMVNLDKDYQVSKHCIDEAFEMTEKYWNKDGD